MAELHAHRDIVRFVNGAEVTAVSFLTDQPYRREQAPSFGLYLDAAWAPSWPYDQVDWPDFGVPADEAAFRNSVRDLLTRSERGENVEIGCLGGHGRTGTALACLAVLAGTPCDEAVEWVRATYCRHAVETDAQAAFVATFARRA